MTHLGNPMTDWGGRDTTKVPGDPHCTAPAHSRRAQILFCCTTMRSYLAPVQSRTTLPADPEIMASNPF